MNKKIIFFLLITQLICIAKASSGFTFDMDDDYVDFIFRLHELLEEEDEEDFSGNMRCNFELYSYTFVGSIYRCNARNNINIISKESAIITLVTGLHVNFKGYADVVGFHDDSSSHIIHYFPQRLEKIFENLKVILINYGRLKEIQQSELKPLPKLVYLNLNENDIEILEDGIFDYNPLLTFLSLENNKLIQIGTKVFDNLNKLTWLLLTVNPCINLKANNNLTSVREIVSQTKISCPNSDYMVIDKSLKMFEDSLVCVNSEALPIFEKKFQILESQFRNSNFSRSMVLNQRFKAVSDWKTKDIWTVKSKVEDIETSVTSSRSDIISYMNKIKNDLTVAQNNQILKLSEKIDLKHINLERLVNESIKSFSNDIKTMMSMKISAMEFMIHNKTDNMQQFSNDSIKELKEDLTTKISAINDRMSTIESSILHLSSIMQDFINFNTKSSSQLQSELKDRLKITNYKIDKNSMIQDYSKSMLIGSCALLITLVLVIMYKKILTRPDDLVY